MFKQQDSVFLIGNETNIKHLKKLVLLNNMFIDIYNIKYKEKHISKIGYGMPPYEDIGLIIFIPIKDLQVDMKTTYTFIYHYRYLYYY